MDPKDFSKYESLHIRVVPFPEAEDCGDGWWRSEWHVETTPRKLPGDLRLPRPLRELEGLTFVVAAWPRKPGRITVEAFSRHKALIGEEVAYISLIMQAIRDLYQEITIDGYSDHPILRMCKVADKEPALSGSSGK